MATIGYERLCVRCEETKPVSQFVRGRRSTRRVGRTCAACRSADNQALFAEKQAWIDAYKIMKGCTDCGYNAHACALDFDHLPGTVKEFGIGGYNASLARIQAEIAKCEVVCANCHRVRTKARRLAVV